MPLHPPAPAPVLPTAAVVLCTFNGERYLTAQLDSLRSQIRQPEFYVLSDDASTDGSWALLQAFARDRRTAGCEVVLHRNPANLGYVRHFEAALQRTDADVLFPCDQDDIWHPCKLGRMLVEFASRPDLLVLHADARLVDGDGHALDRGLLDVLEVSAAERQAMHAGQAFHVLLRRNIVTGAVMAMRRTLLPLALPVADGWSHDEWLAMVAAVHGHVDTLDECLVDYRQHGGNQIGVRERTFLQRHLGVGVQRRAFLRRHVERQRGLLAHLSAAPTAAEAENEHASAVADRLAHAMHRADLPGHPIRRLDRVWREWKTGRYQRYGSGWRSAASDLFGLD